MHLSAFRRLAICFTLTFAVLAVAAQESAPAATSGLEQTSTYDKAIFRSTIPSAQLEFLNRYAGQKAKNVLHDKQYKNLIKATIPDVMFHYGWDMTLADALEKVLNDSQTAIQIRASRYVEISGRNGPYLRGRGFVWIDMQEGTVLGGFYFHPTNGEPTPTVTVFSRQIKEDTIKMSQLPPAFAEELTRWSAESNVSQITTRYFIGDVQKKILLQHDEDYCSAPNASPAKCEQMNADAADFDLDAANYLEQVDYATNATAWMINGPEQVAWFQVRDNTCAVAPDILGCRIRITRQRVQVIINRHSVAQTPRIQPPHK